MKINNIEAQLLAMRADKPAENTAVTPCRTADNISAPPQMDIRLGAQLNAMEKNWQGTIEHKPYSNSRTVGWLLVGLRRIARRLVLRQFAEETVNQQNRFNEAAFRSVDLLGEQARYSAQVEQQHAAHLDELNRRCARLEEERDTLRQQCAQMQTAQEQQLARLQTAKEQLAEADRATAEGVARIEAANREAAERLARLEAAEQELQRRIERLDGQNTALLETVRADNGLRSGEYAEQTVTAVAGYLSRQQAAVTASQSGEDGIISYLLDALGIPAQQRSYLDIGANHAVALSNTFRFYAGGASGVLVEANPFLADELRRMRPRDVVLNRCIADEGAADTLSFYILNGDGLSSCDRASVDAALRNNPALVVESTVEVGSITIGELIRQHMPQAPAILTIDIEGMEEAVLRGIDWQSWRPPVVIVETVGYDCTTVLKEKQTDAVRYMEQQGYVEYAFTGINSIMADASAFRKGGAQR
ncbi:MAG: FkbM family methyltransferase [Ruminococcaceae bacterium]|nr:FkbM family methyltransferase [Oscillospiraceae bacterium]